MLHPFFCVPRWIIMITLSCKNKTHRILDESCFTRHRYHYNWWFFLMKMYFVCFGFLFFSSLFLIFENRYGKHHSIWIIIIFLNFCSLIKFKSTPFYFTIKCSLMNYLTMAFIRTVGLLFSGIYLQCSYSLA